MVGCSHRIDEHSFLIVWGPQQSMIILSEDLVSGEGTFLFIDSHCFVSSCGESREQDLIYYLIRELMSSLGPSVPNHIPRSPSLNTAQWGS